MSTLYDLFHTSRVVDAHNLPLAPNNNLENLGDYAKISRRQIDNLAVNDTDIPAILNAHVAGVVGSTINIQSTLQDAELGEQFEHLVKEHGKIFNFDISGRFHRNEGFRLMEQYKVQHGGILVRYHYNSIWKIPMRVELINVDRIDTAKSDKNTKNGLQKNRYGRVTSIWLYDSERRTSSSKYSMKNIIYYALPWINLSQYTAVSRLVTVLSDIAKQNNYMDEELKAAIERAKAGVYWSTELYSPVMDAFSKMISTNASTEAVLEAKQIMADLATRGISAHGATPIPVDDKIHDISRDGANSVAQFTQQTQKSISAAVGGSAVSVYKDVGIGNYASIKAAISFDEEGYKIDFDRLTSIVIDNYLERLFMIGVQIGRLNVDREKYFSNREDYHFWDVLRVSKRSVDEKVAAAARSMDLLSGATTKQREFGEKGLDYRTEMVKQIKADIDIAVLEKEMYNEAGIEMPTDEVKKEEPTEPTEEEDDKDE